MSQTHHKSKLLLSFLLGLLLLALPLSAFANPLTPELSAEEVSLAEGGDEDDSNTIFPFIPGERVEIDIASYFLGEELIKTPLKNIDGVKVPAVLLGLVMMGAILGGFVAMAAPLFFALKFLDGTVSGVKEDEEFQTKAKAFATQAKDEIKAAKQSAPANERPDHERDGWSAISTAMVSGILAYLFGYAGGISLGASPSTMALWFGIFGFLGALLAMRPNFFAISNQGEKAELNWGLLWVIVSGLIVVGLGTGIVALFRLGGAG